MWEDKRVRQINMWERIFLKVRYNKQPGKKDAGILLPQRKELQTHSGTQLHFAACASKDARSSLPLLTSSST